ncbi:glycoside hydrolase family 2 protein [Paenibacillus allorhizosphaerae]|uniref:Beta-galactosidase n=1 Tax=Paenibacillus allorhizosphaerae TaxID=2849866 RepID=A0ABN7THN3_9BACL|nr:sugar-binding domain-containing protein [Paenibacillus allorhizosphaerae]CAG7628724.1 Beta-galactosidase [Paenibacillus allorhizosphaerae]
MAAKQARTDYPRPQFERAFWLNLNGEWEFEFDDEQRGDKEKWYSGRTFTKSIQVPFCCQSPLSGVGDPAFHDVVWYRKSVSFPEEFAGKRTILHFGAVDYLAWVWVNGLLVKFHEGGHTPFAADITDTLTSGANVIVVKAQDFSKDMTLPRGKQYWKEKSQGIFYTRTTGIWQTVWAEAVAETSLRKVKLTPDIDANEIQIHAFVDGFRDADDIRLKTRISFKGAEIAEDVVLFKTEEESRRIKLHEFNEHRNSRWWTPERPNLYDIEFTLLVNGQQVDLVNSYFGMRKISIEDGSICLNNRPYKMKMVLDQGYFPDGILTPPSDDAIRQDVQMTKDMGFNGARKHQKIEDPRYLYWCDKLGLLVWGEMANAYSYSDIYVRRMMQEWQEAIERDYNHPCIVAWVPINESWGVPNILIDKNQQQHALTMYHLTKSLDATRPVISNDGWEHVRSDICTIHDYQWRREVLEERYATKDKAVTVKPAGKWIYVPGFPYQGEPIHVSEFGGISFKKSDWEGWGYSGAENEQDFIDRLVAVVHPLLHSSAVQGYCYTQLTDVEQEINGLLTYDRKPKIPLELIKQINEGKIPVWNEP